MVPSESNSYQYLILDNASTTETDDKQASEDIEDIDEEEGTDGVSSEGEKPGGNDNLQVKWIHFWKTYHI